jgi:ABC-type branched-subunit amino acid transport system ATPase component
VARPRPLLLDEPSMGLVPILVDQIFAIIRKLKAEGLTMLLVEQNAYASPLRSRTASTSSKRGASQPAGQPRKSGRSKGARGLPRHPAPKCPLIRVK